MTTAKPLCQLTHLEALARVQELEATDCGRLAMQINAIKEHSSGISLWWAMVEAQEELADQTIPDTVPILHFMGSGASTVVTAGEIRGMLAAIYQIKP